jgi:hypothetical protein
VLKIFEPKKDEVIGGCKKQHNDLHNFFYLPNIIRKIKSRTVRYKVCSVHDGYEGHVQNSEWKPDGKRLFEGLGVGVRVLLQRGGKYDMD